MHTTSPSEWAAAGSLGLVAIGVFGLVLPFAQANAAYFDPRRCDESDRALPVLIAVANALYGVRAVAGGFREFGRDAAALLILLTTAPKGAL